MNKLFAISFLSLLLASNTAFAADAPSVQVQTVALKQQAMSDSVSGYGVVSPDTHSLHTISLPRPGQIVSLGVSTGQVVKKGAPLLAFGTSADAALGYQQARDAVDFARSETARVEQLVGQQLATQSQLAAAKKAQADAEAGLHGQEKIGANQALERVVAPFNGVVVAVLAAQGDRMAAGATVLQLARAGGQRVLLGVEPEDMRRVRPGMAVKVNPVFGGPTLVGRITQVFGLINAQTQLVDVLVEVTGDGMLPGMRVRADIDVDLQTLWVVPRSAVLNDDQGAYLFQIVQGKAHRVTVQTSLEQASMIAVQGDFDPKLPVVSLGNYELRDGMAVHGGMQ